jgi:hypothetical protein
MRFLPRVKPGSVMSLKELIASLIHTSAPVSFTEKVVSVFCSPPS